jgi:hypothetical protein
MMISVPNRGFILNKTELFFKSEEKAESGDQRCGKYGRRCEVLFDAAEG